MYYLTTTSELPFTKDNVELELAVKVLISVIAPAGTPTNSCYITYTIIIIFN